MSNFIKISRFNRDKDLNRDYSRCDASKYKPLNKTEALQLIKQRSVYIWGAGQKGRGFRAALERNGIPAVGFIDSSPAIAEAEKIDGLPVMYPHEFFKCETPSTAFVLTASVDKKNAEIAEVLAKNGFSKDQAFSDIQTFCPFYPTVEITGICNLRCSSCVRADPGLIPNGKYMSFEDYKLVIDKMVLDIPFVYLVDLYVFGEPILNKDLPKIIEYNHELGIASGISTNLNKIDNLRAVMKAKPAQIRISISGLSKETYELTHTGGKWHKVSKHLRTLRDLRDEFTTAETGSTLVEFYFHLYKHNMHEVSLAKALCDDYGFRFHPALAVLFSDFVLDYRKSGSLNDKAKTASDLTLLSLDKLIIDCDEYSDKNCILTRIIPVINWDLSVMACCNYTYSSIHTNYLDCEFDELVSRRTKSNLCADCQDHSLHRWNDQIQYQDFVREVVTGAI